MHLFCQHKKMFKMQIKRMATIRYYIIKSLNKREAYLKENITLD